VAFRHEVRYLDDCVPQYVDLNAEEFKRVVRLIESILPELVSAHTRVEWEATAKDLYAARLREAESLAHDLRAAFAVAGPALDTYGQELTKAKAKVEEGDAAADQLARLMEPITWYQTPNFHQSEPLAHPSRCGGPLSVCRARVRGRADHRARCARRLPAEMRSASRELPDFKADSNAAETIVETAPGVMVEMGEATAVDVASLKDPKQNIMITAKVLADGKDTTDFTYTDPRDMTPEQGRRLAAICNGGPNWDGGDAQRYADEYGKHVDEAGKSLR